MKNAAPPAGKLTGAASEQAMDSILPCDPSECKRLFDVESYSDRWLDCSGIYTYVANSPARPGREPVYSPDWQQQELDRIVEQIRRQTRKRLKVLRVVEPNRQSHRLAIGSRKKLSFLIAYAQAFGGAILAWDWSRFLRPRSELWRLDRFGVDFVTIVPLYLTDAELRAMRVQVTDNFRMRKQTALLKLPLRKYDV